MRYSLSLGLLVLVVLSAIVVWQGRILIADPIDEAGSLSASRAVAAEGAVPADDAATETASEPAACCASGCASCASPTPPVACTLTESDRANRKTKFRTALLPLVQETKELDNGFALRFAPSDDVLLKLVDWVTVERQCCRFFRFRLTVEMDEGPFWFELTGPEGTKELLASIMRPADQE